MTTPSPFPNDLLDATARRRLVKRRNRPAVAQLAGHLAVLVASGGAVFVSGGTSWIVLSLVVHGLVLVFLFAPLHETIHDTAFRTKALNRVVATVLGTLLLLPAGYFRHFHAAHHRLTNVPGDPELSEGRPTGIAGYVIHISGWPLWRDRVIALLRHASGRVEESFIPIHRRPAITHEARGTLLFYAALGLVSGAAGWGDAVLWLWIVPMVIGQPFLRVFLLAEHGGRPQVPDMLRNSRTTQSTTAMRALAWNMPYHSEHHAFPWVPFHALPIVHAQIKPHLIDVAPGYAATLRQLLRDAKR
jgi:fatty acid desaturase